MQRLLSVLSTAALFATVASAQCFESSFGTLIGTGLGDDTLFAVQPMNITFPMGGVATTYNALQCNTNGVIFLTNGVAVAGGSTGTGYSGTAATMVTNLRGTATGAPRLAAYWRDLNILAANGGGVLINNTIPGKCVVTWRNAVHFGQTSPIFTVQAQIFADGHVTYFYSGTTQNTATTPICGVSQGALVADPGITDLSVGAVGVSTTKIAYQTFPTVNTFDLQNLTVSFNPNAGGGYDVVPGACVPASNQSYGVGCYSTFASFYQSFATAALASPALSNTSYTMTLNPNGYTVAAAGASLFPTTNATNLVLTDDSEVLAPALSAPLSFPGGTTSQLAVCSNGYVAAALGNNTTFQVSSTILLGNPQAAWHVSHDMNPSILGSGQVKYEETGGMVYVTWDGVWDFGGTTAADANTMQIQFNLSTGNVTVVFGTLSSLGASGIGWVVGWSPAGPSGNPGSTTLPPATPFSTGPDAPALALSATPNPVSTASLGTTMTYAVSNIPDANVSSGLYIATTILSIGQDLAGTSLAPMAPGCQQYITTLDVFLAPVIFTGPSGSQTFSLPAGVAPGFQFFAQSVALVVPNSLPNGQNTAGLVTSNGVKSTTNGF